MSVKGSQFGECALSACNALGANSVHKETNVYYCQSCAVMINFSAVNSGRVPPVIIKANQLKKDELAGEHFVRTYKNENI